VFYAIRTQWTSASYFLSSKLQTLMYIRTSIRELFIRRGGYPEKYITTDLDVNIKMTFLFCVSMFIAVIYILRILVVINFFSYFPGRSILYCYFIYKRWIYIHQYCFMLHQSYYSLIIIPWNVKGGLCKNIWSTLSVSFFLYSNRKYSIFCFELNFQTNFVILFWLMFVSKTKGIFFLQLNYYFFIQF
jgi:hypothetical protein